MGLTEAEFNYVLQKASQEFHRDTDTLRKTSAKFREADEFLRASLMERMKKAGWTRNQVVKTGRD
jgi:hypothetical protein